MKKVVVQGKVNNGLYTLRGHMITIEISRTPYMPLSKHKLILKLFGIHNCTSFKIMLQSLSSLCLIPKQFNSKNNRLCEIFHLDKTHKLPF